MALPRSKVTSQGQISIPLEVRRKLGIGPGSVLEWAEDAGEIIVRRSGQFSSEDIHRKVFRQQALRSRTLDELKEGIRRRARERYARD